jgi:hypothetical protein
MDDNPDYPDPDDLLRFVEAPRIFHSMVGRDVEVAGQTTLIAQYEYVEYTFAHESTLYSDEADEWLPAANTPYQNFPPAELFEEALDISVGSDYVQVNGILGDLADEGVEYEVTWVLEDIRILANPA